MKWIAVAAAVLVTLAGCSGQSSTETTVTETTTATVTVTADSGASGDTFEMGGEIAVVGEGNHFKTPDDETCEGIGGYSDLAAGAPVTVYNADGKVVGLGSITSTVYSAGACTMEWSASDIPGGQGPYQYEVSHRGKVTIGEDDARAGKASSSIG